MSAAIAHLPGATHDASGLSYVVELWHPGSDCFQEVARAADPSIAFTVFYVVVREYPARHVTLRHNGVVISSANAGA